MTGTTMSIDLLRTIILSEMGMNDDRVSIFNQKWKIPPDDGLFVVLEYRSGKLIRSRDYFSDVNGNFTEIQDLNVQEHISICIMSGNFDAMRRKEEGVMALNSVYSQTIQEQNSFHIARMSPIINASQAEASRMLTRFDLDVILLSWYEKQKTVDFYNTFPTRIVNELGHTDFDPSIN
jgi:hypothetical protein